MRRRGAERARDCHVCRPPHSCRPARLGRHSSAGTLPPQFSVLPTRADDTRLTCDLGFCSVSVFPAQSRWQISLTSTAYSGLAGKKSCFLLSSNFSDRSYYFPAPRAQKFLFFLTECIFFFSFGSDAGEKTYAGVMAARNEFPCTKPALHSCSDSLFLLYLFVAMWLQLR